MLPRFRGRRHGQKIFLFIERAVIPRSSAGADRDCSSGQTPASPEYNVVVHFWPLSLTTAATSSSSSSPLLLSQRQTGGRRNPPFREREREKKNRKQWGLPAAEARMCTAEGLHSTRIAAVRARQYSVVTDWIDIDHKLVIYRLTPDEARAHARTLLTHQLLLYWFGSTFLVVARSLIRSPLGQKNKQVAQTFDFHVPVEKGKKNKNVQYIQTYRFNKAFYPSCRRKRYLPYKRPARTFYKKRTIYINWFLSLLLFRLVEEKSYRVPVRACLIERGAALSLLVSPEMSSSSI